MMHVKDIDGWVNPENTKMEMARLHDGSISSLIRYFGAVRDCKGVVVQDTIRDELSALAGKTGVEPGTVIVTGPGALKASNNVKAVFHVAGLQGDPGYGYQPVRDYPGCVRRTLSEVDRLNRSGWPQSKPLGPKLLGCSPGKVQSVLIPLFGSRSAQQSASDVAFHLFKAAVVFLEQHSSGCLDEVYFLAYTDQDKQACETALGSLELAGWIDASKRAGPPQSGKPAA